MIDEKAMAEIRRRALLIELTAQIKQKIRLLSESGEASLQDAFKNYDREISKIDEYIEDIKCLRKEYLEVIGARK